MATADKLAEWFEISNADLVADWMVFEPSVAKDAFERTVPSDKFRVAVRREVWRRKIRRWFRSFVKA